MVFKSRLLSPICPVQKSVFNIVDPNRLILLTRLRLSLSHLNKFRFWHNFVNCSNPFCSCSLVTEDTFHYLLYCHHFSQYRLDLMNSVKSVLDDFKSFPDNDKKDILLYVDSHLDNNKNKYILEATLNYIKNSERFSGSFFEYRFFLFAFFIQSIPTLNLTIKYHSFSMHIVYYYLFLHYLSIYTLIS